MIVENIDEIKNEKRLRTEFKITSTERDYVDEIKKKYNLGNRDNAISKIISEHRDPRVEESLKDIKKEIQINTSILNKIDKITKILLEVMNAVSIEENYQHFIPTSEFNAEIVKGAKNEVEKRIDEEVIKSLDERRKR